MTDSRKIRAQIFVEGWVQGVGYRYFVQDEALALGLQGLAKNLADGRVEIILEGAEEKVKKLIPFLKEGPTLARVKNLNVTFEPATGEFANFYVR